MKDVERLALLLALAACADAETRDSAPDDRIAESDFTGPVVHATLNLDELPEWELGENPTTVIAASETDPDYLFYNIGDVVRLTNGSVVVSSPSDALRIFSAAGKHQMTVGRRGAGPGEYGQIITAGVLRGDTIATFDDGLGRITLLTPGGRYVRSYAVRGAGYVNAFLTDGRLVDARADRSMIDPRGAEPYREELEITVRDPATDSVTVIGRVNDRIYVRGNSVPYSPRARLATGGNRIFVTPSDSYTIRVFEGTRPLFEIRADPPKRRIADEDIAQWIANTRGGGDSARIARYHAEVRDKAPAYRSEITGLLATPSGVLWAWHRDAWHIYDRNGRLLAWFGGSHAMNIRAVGDGWALLGRYGADGLTAFEVWPVRTNDVGAVAPDAGP